MPAEDANKAYTQTYRHYLGELSKRDLPAVAARLGLPYRERQIQISLLQQQFFVGPERIVDEAGVRPGLDCCVILSKYIIMCPEILPPAGHWAAYRDFRDTGPLTVYFRNEVEVALIKAFAADLPALEAAAGRLGGYPPDTDAAYSLKMQFDVLPHIPMLVLFNDADEEFPADCSILFRASAEGYLDGESLAMLAHRLVAELGKQ